MNIKATIGRTRPIPSVPEFKKLSPERKERAYIAGYRSLVMGHAPRPDARRLLLRNYIIEAGWSEEQVTVLHDLARKKVD